MKKRIYAILEAGEIIEFAWGLDPVDALNLVGRGDDARLTKWERVPRDLSDIMCHKDLGMPTLAGSKVVCEGLEWDLMDEGEKHPNPKASRLAPEAIVKNKTKANKAKEKINPPKPPTHEERIAALEAEIAALKGT